MPDNRLAQFRANYGKFAGIPWWMELIDELNRANEEFRAWWPQHSTILYLDAPHLTVTINIPSSDDDTISKLSKLLLE